jgi:Hypervirulence associated proteins TUDOR domain
MPKTFRIGDSVEWEGPRGKVRGKVKRKLTARTKVRDSDVDASEEDPKYVVATDDTGEESAQGPDSLDKVN